MSTELMLNVEERTASTKGGLKKMRTDGFIPAVVYGHNTETKKLKISRGEFEKVFSQAGESTLVNLKIGDKQNVKTLIYDIERDAVKGRVLHVDFYEVNMKEKVTANVELNYIGESIAVSQKGGVLMKNLDEIEVECLPGDLVKQIDIDISVLKEIDDAIKIGNIKFPKGVEPTGDKEEAVVSVIAHKVEEEAPAPAATEVPAEGAKLEEKKAEEVKK